MATQCEIIDRVYKFINDARTSVIPHGPLQAGTESDAGYGDILMGTLNNILIELEQFSAEEACKDVDIDTTPIVPPPSIQYMQQ